MTELNMKSCSPHKTPAGLGFATGPTTMEVIIEQERGRILLINQSSSAREFQ
jgi:hypothetical protein